MIGPLWIKYGGKIAFKPLLLKILATPLIYIYIYIYSRHQNYRRLVFFIILYPYFTLIGLIFILEAKFQSFLAEPTHMPDLSSE